MAKIQHDYIKPFEEHEIEGLKDVFRSLPTFTSEGYILPSDYPLWLERIGFARSSIQIAAYQRYWDQHFGGKIPMSELIATARVYHDAPALFKLRAAIYDTDKDGYISFEEFKEYMNLMAVIHEPKLQGLTAEDFLEEADTSKDGKVSIEEFGGWIAGKLA